MTSPSNPLSDWVLERLARGELTGAQKAEAMKRLEAEPNGPARLAALAASDTALRAELPAWSRIEARAAKQRAAARFRLALAVPVLAGVLGLVVLYRSEGPPQPGLEGPEVTRIKGNARLFLARQTPAGAEPLGEGSQARAGDVVQLAYVMPPNHFGVIVSLDGRGAVTLHFPETAEGSTALAAAGELAHAYRLDDAPGFERFVLVASDRPVKVEAVLAAARVLAQRSGQAQTGALVLPAGWSQSSVLLRKVGP